MNEITTSRFSGFNIPPIEEVARIIADPNASIVDRVRCLFCARHYGGKEAVKALIGAIGDSSVLLVHEAAYVLGQVGEPSAIPYLTDLLNDLSQHCMVRHEAAEALAAIGDSSSIELIQKYVNDKSAPVRETIQLALRSLEEKADNRDDREYLKPTTGFYLYSTDCCKFSTTDPIARKNQLIKQLPCDQLRQILLNEKENLYLRYEALFALRDKDTEDARNAVVESMKDRTSALFRHEVAFVLGQIQTPQSVSALVECLKNLDEHPMARHEAALALGSVGCNTTEEGKTARKIAIETLLRFTEDPEPIVYESCLVGLDNIRHETGNLVY